MTGAGASIAIWLGTLILYLPSPHGAYIAADSRHDGGDPAQRDEARKIFLCGKAAVCAISGGLRLEVTDEAGRPARLDLAQLVQATSARMRAGDAGAQSPDALLTELLKAVNPEVQSFWARHLEGRRTAAPMSRRLGAASLFTLFFAARAPGTGELSVVQVMYPFREQQLPDGTWIHTLRDPIVRPADPSRPLAQGRTECMQIRPDQPPDTATRDSTLATLESLYARAQQLDACAAIIGGPVDIAVLEDNEVRWLRVK